MSWNVEAYDPSGNVVTAGLPGTMTPQEWVAMMEPQGYRFIRAFQVNQGGVVQGTTITTPGIAEVQGPPGETDPLMILGLGGLALLLYFAMRGK